MANGGTTRRYTASDIQAMRARGEDRTDWAGVDAKTEADLEHDIATDPDWADIPEDWYKDAVMGMPLRKQLVSVRLDADMLAWFRAQGPGYQTRLNAVLRAYMRSMQAVQNGKLLAPTGDGQSGG